MHYLILAVLIWASAFIAGKYSSQILDPVLVVQCRLLIAALIVLPFFPKAYRLIPPSSRRRVWLLALLNFPAVLLLQFTGLYYTSAASAVTMIGAAPIIIVLVGYVFFRRPTTMLHWILGAVAFVGIFLIVSESDTGGDISLWGCLLVLAGVVVFAFCVHMSQALLKYVPSAYYTTVILVLGALLCLPFTLLLTRNWHIGADLSGILGVLYLGVGCTWLAYKLWYKGLPDTSAAVSGLISALEPVFGVIMAVLLLGERLRLSTLIGVILVIGATAASTLAPIIRARFKSKQV
ncbi:DMT family transporter [Caviibacterium pharyngocola]|uniref:EamA family transporter n=1 Tax=Caviibacterium pharyngocola TaxID=28159 RepID=A0A2M8RYE5_9PAST|nr:DMT family transporter [Caviibacterium pharyngocola]PJG83920.1 EamA family transporter [Caviibacterium pharyngocola]